MTSMPPADLRPVRRAIARVRRRVVLQTVLDRGVLGLVVAAGVGIAGLHALRLGLLPVGALDTLPLVVGGVAALGLLSGLFVRLSDVAAAKRLDDAAGLNDRLSGAVSFSATPTPTPFMNAAMADAAAHAPRAVPRMAAPLRAPRQLLPLLAVAVGLGATVFIAPPLPHGEGRAVRRSTPLVPPPVPSPRLLTHEKQELDRTLDRLHDTLTELEGDKAAALAQELRDLIEDIREGRSTGREAFERLARLEDKALTMEEEDLARHADVEKKLRAAAKELAGKDHTKDLKAALERGDLAKASEELKKLADKEKLDRRERDKLAKELQKLASALKDDTQKEKDALQKEVDRLQKKKDKQGDRFKKQEEDRLAKKKKELERIAREQQKRDTPSQKMLERLTRDMQAAADELRRQKGGQGENQDEDALSRAAEEMRRLSRQGAQRKGVKVVRMSAEDVRELLRRARQQGQGEGEEQGADGQPGGGKQGQKQKGLRGKLEDFYTRAGGKKPGEKKKGAGKGESMTLGEGKGKKGDQVVMMEQQGGQGGKGAKMDVESGSDAPGDEHDPNVMGQGTKLDAKRQESFVAGQQQEGQGRSETIQGAAARGFTGTTWREVHHDYSGVVEEDMEKEQIPKGYRRYVERYFDLIRPQ